MRSLPLRIAIAWTVIAGFAAGTGPVAWAAPVGGRPAGGGVALDVTSAYSHIRVRRQGSVVSLLFVRPGGVEAEESRVNLDKPHDLLIPYTRAMFASYLFVAKPERVAIVGLGGGSMVHFLRHYDPEVAIDAVEIDPEVVRIAERYFEIKAGEKLSITTGDGREFLETTDRRFDVIYMDAFLRPSAETDSTGVPLRLKTLDFYKMLQGRLAPGGVVVFNVNLSERTAADVAAIRQAFPQVYAFRPPAANLVVVGAGGAKRLTAAELRLRAREADRRLGANFTILSLVGRMTP